MPSGQPSLAAYRNCHAGTLAESRRSVPAQFDSEPKVLRRACDSGEDAIVSALPVADAARLAGPDLDSRIEGLRVERIAAVTCEFGPRRHARLLRAEMRNAGPVQNDSGPGLWLHAGLPGLAAAIGLRLERHRREFGRRPERLRRKHRPGKVEAEKL